MKKYFYTLIIVVVIVSCKTLRNETKFISQADLPFKILSVNYNTWIGGQPGVKGYHFNITTNLTEIYLDSVFFKNLKAKLEPNSTKNNKSYTATFILQNKVNDLNVAKNSKEEFGNKPSNHAINIPFDLKENESIISFKFNNQTYFYKIFNLKEKPHKPLY